MNSADELLAFLKPRVNSSTTAFDIAELMQSLASDSVWAFLGGSGARQQTFRLPEDLRAVFQFDGSDRLVAYGAYRSSRPWRKEASADPIGPDEVSLIFLQPGSA